MLCLRHGLMDNPCEPIDTPPTLDPVNRGQLGMPVHVLSILRFWSRKAKLVCLQCSRQKHGVSTMSYSRFGVHPVSWPCVLTSQQGKPFEFQRPYGSYIMENVLFKISYPAEFHAQTAVEASHTIHAKLKDMGKTSDDIKSVVIRTQEAAIRIIDKQGPLDNFADRE